MTRYSLEIDGCLGYPSINFFENFWAFLDFEIFKNLQVLKINYKKMKIAAYKAKFLYTCIIFFEQKLRWGSPKKLRWGVLRKTILETRQIAA